jgi:ribosome maturation factor RimP
LPHGGHAPGAKLMLSGLLPARHGGLETPAVFVYISLKFLVGMTKSGSTRSRSFLLPADRFETNDRYLMTATASEGDDRIIRESGIDARIALIVQPVLRGIGFRLVRVHLSGQNGLTLQIMAEREDGTMTVEDCEEVSRAVSPALDVDDPIEKAYHLEVSSPGIDRPLVRKSDFTTWTGHLVKMETSIVVADRKRFKGKIVEAGEDDVLIEREKAAYGEEPTVRVPYDAISETRLILTDDLIRDALSKDNRARKEAKRNRGEPDDDVPEGAEADATDEHEQEL